MKKDLSMAEGKALIYSDQKENATTKKLESLLVKNGFTKTFSGHTDGGWGGDVDCFLLEFAKGNEKVFVNITKPKKGVLMSYADYQKSKEAAAIKQ